MPTRRRTTLSFEMPFEPMTIEHLGLRLYSTLPPVISEFVSNAYDADAPKVEILIPKGPITPDTEVTIRDFGHGMTAKELQEEFLPIGRNRRGKSSKRVHSKSGKRLVTGRKGLGKLSAFGIAGEMDVRTIKNGDSICIRLNHDRMIEWAESHSPSQPYKPEVVHARTKKTREPDGVEITLRRFYRSNSISEDTVRKGIAKRLLVVRDDFRVSVNGTQVTFEDRLSRSECELSWEISETPNAGAISKTQKTTGWLGFLPQSSQSGRGIDIYATGKSVELQSYFNLSSTHAQFARAHLVGQINADFLDSATGDFIGTSRSSVVWEVPAGQALEAWGQALLTWAFGKWIEHRQARREQAIVVETGFDKWLSGRTQREKRIAQRMVKLLVDDDQLDSESAKPLLEIVKSSVETKAFHELVDDLESAEGRTTRTLLRLFDEWNVIEAREHLKLAYGRIEALDQLENYIDEGALEVSEMEPLLASNPWIIDPGWTETQVEQRYTKLIQEHCKESKRIPPKDKRIDIWGVRTSATITVVELKHPEKTLTLADLNQIEEYVDWVRSTIQGTGSHSPRYTNGLLVVGSLSDDNAIALKRARLAGSDIRVETYRDLYQAARSFYDELDRRVQAVAPEYSQSLRKKRAESKGAKVIPTKKSVRRITRKGANKKAAKSAGKAK